MPFFVVAGPSYTELPQDIQILLRNEVSNISAAYARVDVLHQEREKCCWRMMCKKLCEARIKSNEIKKKITTSGIC